MNNENEVRTEIPAVSWEIFISKIKEYLASQDEDVENCINWYEDFLHDTWKRYFVENSNPKYRSLDEANLRQICMPIVMGL